MDLLQQCAFAFKQLLSIEYHFTIGRKGKSRSFILNFDPADFHHLAGLHKIKDNARFFAGKRSDIFQEILAGQLTYKQVARSNYFSEMKERLTPLSQLESFLDQNQIIFHYNEKANKFSLIKADYLLTNQLEAIPLYLFLSQRTDSHKQVCRTFFPKDKLDYTIGQPHYALLKKEKINTHTEECIIQYTQTTPKIPSTICSIT